MLYLMLIKLVKNHNNVKSLIHFRQTQIASYDGAFLRRLM